MFCSEYLLEKVPKSEKEKSLLYTQLSKNTPQTRISDF